MAVKVRFPVIVFTDYGYEACLSARDLCIKSKKDIEQGFFDDLEFLDSNGVLRKVTKYSLTNKIKISFLMHLFYFKRMQAVEIFEVEEDNLDLNRMILKVVDAVCYVANGASKQFDKEELSNMLSKKSSPKSIIEYFSGELPSFLEEYQEV